MNQGVIVDDEGGAWRERKKKDDQEELNLKICVGVEI